MNRIEGGLNVNSELAVAAADVRGAQIDKDQMVPVQSGPDRYDAVLNDRETRPAGIREVITTTMLQGEQPTEFPELPMEMSDNFEDEIYALGLPNTLRVAARDRWDRLRAQLKGQSIRPIEVIMAANDLGEAALQDLVELYQAMKQGEGWPFLNLNLAEWDGYQVPDQLRKLLNADDAANVVSRIQEENAEQMNRGQQPSHKVFVMTPEMAQRFAQIPQVQKWIETRSISIISMDAIKGERAINPLIMEVSHMIAQAHEAYQRDELAKYYTTRRSKWERLLGINELEDLEKFVLMDVKHVTFYKQHKLPSVLRRMYNRIKDRVLAVTDSAYYIQSLPWQG
jgi:hypothetical protein